MTRKFVLLLFVVMLSVTPVTAQESSLSALMTELVDLAEDLQDSNAAIVQAQVAVDEAAAVLAEAEAELSQVQASQSASTNAIERLARWILVVIGAEAAEEVAVKEEVIETPAEEVVQLATEEVVTNEGEVVQADGNTGMADMDGGSEEGGDPVAEVEEVAQDGQPAVDGGDSPGADTGEEQAVDEANEIAVEEEVEDPEVAA